MECKRWVEWEDSLGFMQYSPCGRKSKYYVKFKDGLRGEITEENVCGIHKNSIEKRSKRMMKKLNYDTELVITDL